MKALLERHIAIVTSPQPPCRVAPRLAAADVIVDDAAHANARAASAADGSGGGGGGGGGSAVDGNEGVTTRQLGERLLKQGF